MRDYKLRKEYTKLAFEVYKNAKICIKCFRYRCRIEIHHKNEDITDNSEENLQILCASCHCKHHATWRIVSEETRKKISEAHKWNTYRLWDKVSEETKRKISKWLTWKKRTEEQKKRISEYIKEWYRTWKRVPNMINLWKFWKDNHLSKKVNQYTKDWEFLQTWDWISVVERELWINHWNICQCCLWKHKSAWGFIWKYY